MRTARESAIEALYEEMKRSPYAAMGRPAFDVLMRDEGQLGKTFRDNVDVFERVIVADREHVAGCAVVYALKSEVKP